MAGRWFIFDYDCMNLLRLDRYHFERSMIERFILVVIRVVGETGAANFCR